MRTRICECGLLRPKPRGRPPASKTRATGASAGPSSLATEPEKIHGCPSRTDLSRPGLRWTWASRPGGDTGTAQFLAPWGGAGDGTTKRIELAAGALSAAAPALFTVTRSTYSPGLR